jgi:hypothetical protein
MDFQDFPCGNLLYLPAAIIFHQMFRTPIPNKDQALVEKCGTDQLLGLFAYCQRPESRGISYRMLTDAWGALFSGLYLSAEELVEEVERGVYRLDEANRQMLGRFLQADSRNGCPFILNVIRKGGTIDRAALFMIVEPKDLAAIDLGGTSALHQLADACDKGIRPAFIRRAGRLLATVYDNRGIPVIYTIFGLRDLCLADLEAIATVFSEEDLRGIMCRSRTGKNALTVFSDIAISLNSHAALDRHIFYKSRSPDVALQDGGAKAPDDPQVAIGNRTGVPVQNGPEKKAPR